MARIERVYWCGDCGHECHCHINQCDEWLGIGMTDKSFQCKCVKCNCASTRVKQNEYMYKKGLTTPSQ